MGYTPKTFEALAEIAEHVHALQDSEHNVDGWAPGPRVVDLVRTRHRMSVAGIKDRIKKAQQLGLIVARTDTPGHIDQRATYWQVTPQGLQILEQGKNVGLAAATTQATGQITIDSINDRT